MYQSFMCITVKMKLLLYLIMNVYIKDYNELSEKNVTTYCNMCCVHVFQFSTLLSKIKKTHIKMYINKKYDYISNLLEFQIKTVLSSL